MSDTTGHGGPGPALWAAARTARRLGLTGRRLVRALPTLWLLIFFLVPFAVVLKVSFAEPLIAVPPYTPLAEFADGVLQVTINVGNYVFLTEDPLYINAYLSSIRIAAVSTVLCLIIGYPMAYLIARSSPAWRNTLLMLVILPFWTSFLLRVYAWIGILNDTGLINNALIGLEIIDEPIRMIRTDLSVYLGIVYSYLPLMVLPLYTALEKLDGDLLDASADLGARPLRTFLDVTLPLSLPGILAGCLLVFIPAVGEFVIPELLGGPDQLMIGKVLWTEFFNNRDWPVASSVAIIMLIILVAPIMWFRTIESRNAQRRT